MISGRLISIVAVLSLSVARAQEGIMVIGGVIGEKGAPFSAEITQESDATREGKKIHHIVHGKIYRDSEGRTRVEMEMMAPPGEGEVKIWIADPVRHTFSVMSPQTKKASVSHARYRSGTNQAEPTPGPSPGISGDGSGKAEQGPTTKTEALAPQRIEGFEATGTRTSLTWEPGRLVNGKPITSMSEVWYSTELKTVLLMSSGESSVWRLTNIHQGNPDPALFQIPGDYAVKVVEQP